MFWASIFPDEVPEWVFWSLGPSVFGMILGHFCKWYVLIPACGLAIVLVLAIAAHPEDSLLGSVLQIIVVTTSIQIGYVVGLFAPCFVAGCNIYAAAAIAMSADLISISLAL